MKKIPSQLLLSTVALGVVASLNVNATTLKPVTSASQLATDKLEVQSQRPDITERFVVVFNDASTMSAVSEYQTALQQGLTIVDSETVSKARAIMSDMQEVVGEDMQLIQTLSGRSAVFEIADAKGMKAMRLLAEGLANGAAVASADPDPRRYPLAQHTPYGFNNVQANQVSDSNAGNRKVCVIDSGYAINHEDLSGNQHAGTNGLAGNWNTTSGSHGTHVAGTITAMNNSSGIKGLMPNQNVNLHIIKVFDDQGFTYASGLAGAVNDCVSAGSQVVNMSLGGPSASNSDRNAMQSALNSGVLLVAAAGNDSNGTHSYPASYDAVISVAAVDEDNFHAPFSQDTDQVEISGPGEAVYSTVSADGLVGTITYGSTTLENFDVAPLRRVVPSNGVPTTDITTGVALSDILTDFSGDLGACTLTAGAYDCGDMTDKVCVVERNGNESRRTWTYPDVDAVKACQDAGAVGAVVYGNTERPSLKANQVRDIGMVVTIPSVSVSRAHGQQLAAAAGTNASVAYANDANYALYDGTSMASPHVAGAVALAWSTKPTCTAAQVREAMQTTALDLGSAGRDNETGHGLIQTKAMVDKLAEDNCGSTAPDNALTNGTAVAVEGTTGSNKIFTLAVPANASNLKFDLTGGTGDADLYVKFASAPTTSDYECRSWESGNTEQCPISNAQVGTYYVMVHGYAAYTNANLTASYTVSSGNTGGSASQDNISGDRRAWQRYTLDVPAGMSKLTVTTSGGTGDADLYLRFGASPTTSTYDCRSEDKANTESCVINNPAAGEWHISLYGYQAKSQFYDWLFL